jgi:acyl-CoA synthetase (AMP-forming)/AMP-acid ligase II
VDGAVTFDEFLAGGSSVEEEDAHRSIGSVRADDICDVIFTSGTTARPKGVMLRHGTSLRAFESLKHQGFGGGERDRQVIIPPFFHCFGYKAGWMSLLMFGGTSYPITVFDPVELMTLIERERITHLPGPPPVFRAILDHPRFGEFDLSSLVQTFIGATRVPMDLAIRMREELHAPVFSGYGLTEAHACCTSTLPGDRPEVVATSAGPAVPGIEVRVVDEGGRDVPTGEPGEVLVRGYVVMSGYLGDPEQTGLAIDADGWLHTGDIGDVDAEGRVSIKDRKKDIYISSGFNVSPAEVEHLLSAHPAVASCAVVGIPDDIAGEVGAAAIVIHPGASVHAGELETWCRSHMANYKIPRVFRLVDALPTNATGKVVKQPLKEMLARP